MRPLKQNMYRYPWSSNDNPIGWLEITDKCNIYCRGCYRMNGMAGHKSLEQVKEEVNILQEARNCDNISIAGGEPLIHPDIVEIVSYIHDCGMKPLILTNGVKLVDNQALMEDLKRAGLLGFTFHIDSEQSRPHWQGKSELELCDLRMEYAKMVEEVGGLFVSFGMTIYPTNVDTVPEIVRWANKHIDLVHGLVFITFRAAPTDGRFDYFVEGRKVDLDVTYTADSDEEIHITSLDVAEKIKDVHPHYEAAAYLGGTQTHSRTTWLTAVQIGAKGQGIFGSIGAKAMEMVQVAYHLRYGSYMVYMRSNKLTKFAFLLSFLDKGLRTCGRGFWKSVFRNPMQLFRPIYTQSIGIVQGPDMLEDGRQDMCESCPDMTVWDGKLVHSCRMDEWRLYGNYVNAQRATAGEESDMVQASEISAPERELVSPNK